MNPGISKEEAERRVRAVEKWLRAGYRPPGMNLRRGEVGAISKAAAELNIPSTTLSHSLDHGAACEYRGFTVDWSLYDPASEAAEHERALAGELGTDPVLPAFRLHQTTVQRDSDGNVQKEWVQQKRAPGAEFELPDGHLVKGVSALVDPDGKIIQKWIKTREETNTLALIDAIKGVFDGYRGRAEIAPSPSSIDSDLLTVYPIADLHVGMYSWAAETGESYDLKIVEELFLTKISDIVSRAPPSEVAIVLNLGDYFHSDTRQNRTEMSGHSLDVDSRYARVLQVGVRLLHTAIELALAKHKRVIVRCLAGNHDYHSSLALTTALGAFFLGIIYMSPFNHHHRNNP